MTMLDQGMRVVDATDPEWIALKTAVSAFRQLQQHDGSLAGDADPADAQRYLTAVRDGIRALAPAFPHDADYLAALDADFGSWAEAGFDVPDFRSSLAAFQPQLRREDGLRHLVLFPMTTQNGSPDRLLEAVLIDVLWPDFIDALERERRNARRSGRCGWL